MLVKYKRFIMPDKKGFDTVDVEISINKLLMNKNVEISTTSLKNMNANEQADLHIHKDEKGNISIPSSWILRSSEEAGSMVPYKGRTSHKYLMKGMMIANGEEYIPIKFKKQTTDSRFGNIGGKEGSRQMLHRPCFHNVSIKFPITILDPRISIPSLRLILEKNGLLNGIGSYRVGNGGPFGRFTVDSFKLNGKEPRHE